jgi:hypothetical protein
MHSGGNNKKSNRYFAYILHGLFAIGESLLENLGVLGMGNIHQTDVWDGKRNRWFLKIYVAMYF